MRRFPKVRIAGFRPARGNIGHLEDAFRHTADSLPAYTRAWLRRLWERWGAWSEKVRKRASAALPWELVERWAAPLIIAALVAIFYLPPLASTDAGIHWDAADVHYPMQRYFAEWVRHGIPFRAGY